jgi:DNA-binding transcriptional regulator LsrR (DeoR family)
MSSYDIAKYTGVSRRKIDHVLATFKRKGTVNVHKTLKPHTHQSLCDEDIQVCSETNVVTFPDEFMAS